MSAGVSFESSDVTMKLLDGGFSLYGFTNIFPLGVLLSYFCFLDAATSQYTSRIAF